MIFDLECDGLRDECTKIWVASFMLQPNREYRTETYIEGFKGLAGSLRNSRKLIGHNIINYDLPVLKKLTGWIPGVDQEIFDTIVYSRLLWPDLQSPPGWKGKPAPHSLEAWAMRFGGEQKVGQNDWSVFDPNMITRCESDVRITERLYNHILKEMAK